MGNETRGPQEYQAMIKIGLVSFFFSVFFYVPPPLTPSRPSAPMPGSLTNGLGQTNLLAVSSKTIDSLGHSLLEWVSQVPKISSYRTTHFLVIPPSYVRFTSIPPKLMRWLQIGNYGPNCTTGNKTPHPSDPLLEEESTLQNTTISVPASSPFQFVNGTAIGLTCFVPPESASYSWPYGDGQVNSEQTDKGNGTNGTSASTGSASQTSMASTGSPNRNESAAKRVTDLPGVKGLLLAIAWAMSQSITIGDFAVVI